MLKCRNSHTQNFIVDTRIIALFDLNCSRTKPPFFLECVELTLWLKETLGKRVNFTYVHGIKNVLAAVIKRVSSTWKFLFAQIRNFDFIFEPCIKITTILSAIFYRFHKTLHNLENLIFNDKSSSNVSPLTSKCRIFTQKMRISEKSLYLLLPRDVNRI